MSSNSGAEDALRDLEGRMKREREGFACSLHYLPGRPYPPPPLPSTTNQPSHPLPRAATILEAESEVDEPSATKSETGRVASIPKDVTNQLRDQDREFCQQHCEGRVTANELEALLERMGGKEMVDEYKRLVVVATDAVQKISDADLGALYDCFKHESDKKLKVKNLMMSNGEYWLSYVASVIQFAASDPLPSGGFPLNYIPSGIDQLPFTPRYQKKRKYDASLRPTCSTKPTIHNVLVNVKFTAEAAPNFDWNPLLAKNPRADKVRQGFCNAVDLFALQSTRVLVPSLSFHGHSPTTPPALDAHGNPSPTTTLLFSILDASQWEIVTIPDCFTRDKLASTAALLHLLRTASPYQLGLNPFFEYSFNLDVPSPIPATTKSSTAKHSASKSSSTAPTSADSPTEFALGDMAPSAVVLSNNIPLSLNPTPISPLPYSPFSRSTVVLAGEQVTVVDGRRRRKIVKVSRIADGRSWRERAMVEEITAESKPSWCPTLDDSYAAPPRVRSPESQSAPVPDQRQQKRERDPPNNVTPRHIEIHVFDSPADAVRLDKVATLAEYKSTCIELLDAVRELYEKGVSHRDLASGNVLSAGGRLVLIDWELGRKDGTDAAPESSVVTGTLDTMPIILIRRALPTHALPRDVQTYPFLPHDELESAIYVMFKALTTSFVPSLKLEWNSQVDDLLWNVQPKLSELIDRRKLMWNRYLGERSGPILDLLTEQGHEPVSKVFRTLFDLDLPVQSRDDLSLKSIKEGWVDLVKEAKAAFEEMEVDPKTEWPLKGVA
ncbi:Pkinase-fungal domain-containing protein [Pseudohyphozyma bogoriensis]|nr:Pkinase-fungal domain-containing protein [Pseudohyphozyma bogoriensis]